MSTLTAFMAFMQGIDVAGVTALDGVPNSVKASDLPLSFPMFPEAGYRLETIADSDGLNTFTGDLVILFSKAEQGTPLTDYTKLVKLVDDTHAALLAAARSFESGLVSWNFVTRVNYAVGTSGDFHAITATVTAELI